MWKYDLKNIDGVTLECCKEQLNAGKLFGYSILKVQ